MEERSVRHRDDEQGSAMLEFILAGIASAALIIGTLQIGIAMWNYHTLSYAVHETNRYIVVHGRDCALGGNTCTINVGNIVTKLTGNAVGLLQANTIMTLTSNSGTVYTCSPISSCSSDSTQWPPVANFDNMVGNYSTIKGSYTFKTPLVALWYGWKGMRIGSITLASQSKLQMLF